MRYFLVNVFFINFMSVFSNLMSLGVLLVLFCRRENRGRELLNSLFKVI